MRQEQREKYPNLAKSPVYIPVQNFKTNMDFEELPRDEVQGFIEELLETQGMKTSPDKYPLEGRETVDLVIEGGHKIFEGEIKIPEKYQGENAQNDAIFS